MGRASECIGVADVGASGGRVSALVRHGGGYGLETIHEFVHPRHDMHVADAEGVSGRRIYWNPYLIYDGMAEGLRRVGAGDYGDLVSFGLDSWGSDGAWISRGGDLLFPSCSCHCERFAVTRREIEDAMPARERYRHTGVYPDEFLVVNQVLWACRHMREVVDLADMFMPLVSLYNFWFSGVRAVEYTWLTTGHLGSSITRSYCEPIISRLGLPREKLPPLRLPGQVLGESPKRLAEGLGLKPFQVLLPSNHDTACAFAAATLAPGRASLVISAGTWWCMGAALAEPLVTDASYAAHFSNVAGLEGVIFNVINMGSLPAQELRRRWGQEDGRPLSWEEYNRLAASGHSPDLHFDIDDTRLRTAPDMPGMVAEVAGLAPGKANRGRVAALVYMGLARKAARLAGVLGDLTGKKVDEILVIGGGARNDLLNQWMADVSRLPVRTGPPNATTLGNALSQAVTLGWFSSLDEGRAALAGLWEEKVFLPA